MSCRSRLLVVILLILSAADALAEGEVAAAPPASSEDSPPARPTRWGVGVGGFTAITGPAAYGMTLEAELYPGSWRRYGLRAEIWSFETSGEGRLALGVTYEAAATRPRLQLALHADLGMTSDEQPTLGGGIQTQLWIKGPLALGLDAAGLLIYDGTDSVLVLATGVSLRLSV